MSLLDVLTPHSGLIDHSLPLTATVDVVGFDPAGWIDPSQPLTATYAPDDDFDELDELDALGDDDDDLLGDFDDDDDEYGDHRPGHIGWDDDDLGDDDDDLIGDDDDDLLGDDDDDLLGDDDDDLLGDDDDDLGDDDDDDLGDDDDDLLGDDDDFGDDDDDDFGDDDDLGRTMPRRRKRQMRRLRALRSGQKSKRLKRAAAFNPFRSAEDMRQKRIQRLQRRRGRWGDDDDLGDDEGWGDDDGDDDFGVLPLAIAALVAAGLAAGPLNRRRRAKLIASFPYLGAKMVRRIGHNPFRGRRVRNAARRETARRQAGGARQRYATPGVRRVVLPGTPDWRTRRVYYQQPGVVRQRKPRLAPRRTVTTWTGPKGGKHKTWTGRRGRQHHVTVGPRGRRRHTRTGAEFGVIEVSPEGYAMVPKLQSAAWAHPVQTGAVLLGAYAVGAAVGSDRTMDFFRSIGDTIAGLFSGR
jgi:hypothetical protein